MAQDFENKPINMKLIHTYKHKMKDIETNIQSINRKRQN